MSVNVKSGMSAVSGYIGGAVFNKEERKFEIKKGKSEKGFYMIFAIKVSSKDQEGNYTNGKDIKVKLTGTNKEDFSGIEIGESVGVLGWFNPDNYTNSEGKEIRGLVLQGDAKNLFTPDSWDKKEAPKEEDVKEEEIPW